MTGPSIAGMMFTIGTPNMAIYINSIALFLSALIPLGMPNVEVSTPHAWISDRKLSVTMLEDDWRIVIRFSCNYAYIMIVYFLFSAMIVLKAATDSLEAAFATQVLSLSEGEYGGLVSIAGAGVLVGSLTNTNL